MSLLIEPDQIRRKQVDLEDELQSIGKKERTLKREVERLEGKLAIKELEEKLRKRDFPILYGEKAVEALRDFIGEISEQRGKELTEKQVEALIEFVNGLILSIKTDTLPIHEHMRTRTEWYASPESLRSLYLS